MRDTIITNGKIMQDILKRLIIETSDDRDTTDIRVGQRTRKMDVDERISPEILAVDAKTK